MTRRRHGIFLFNLLQDVNVLRPLAYLVARELDVRLAFLITGSFLERDTLRTWQRELSEMAAATGADLHIYETPADALAVLQGKQGFIIAASESTLTAHANTHNVFRLAPSSFLKITMQHGYECVGFLQNREHDVAHGLNIRFAADVICGWCEAPALTSLAASERPKLHVSGPPFVLCRQPAGEGSGGGRTGLICENLHSPRLNATGSHGESFMRSFASFCETMDAVGQAVSLRPHPGGMYVVKNNIALPSNVRLSMQPIYKVPLSSFSFGISAPSTVVLDMLLAGLPVAVWRDEAGIMDASNYDGLVAISRPADWLAFARDAVVKRDEIIAQQQAFLARLRMPVDPKDVYRRFASLFANATTSIGEVRSPAANRPAVAPRRIAFVANGLIPTLQLSFLKPLAQLLSDGTIAHEILTEVEANELFPVKVKGRAVNAKERARKIGDWMDERLAAFEPDLIVACRYSAPGAGRIAGYARRAGVPLIYHIDDDLLNIPPEIGEKKYLAHNHPSRLMSVNTLLRRADLVYASTPRLKARLRQLSYRTSMVHGGIYCSGKILSPAEQRPVRCVGYMGFDHAHDFAIVLPELVDYLRRNPEINFELFGSIPKPVELEEFGERVHVVPPVRDYEEFMAAFAARQWDIGLCPLAKTPFNEVKANTKWVEYSCAGAAVLATRGMVYDDCCSGGCGALLERGEWLAALEDLTRDPVRRYEMVRAAQVKVASEYSVERLEEQVLTIFAEARQAQVAARTQEQGNGLPGPFASKAMPLQQRIA